MLFIYLFSRKDRTKLWWDVYAHLAWVWWSVVVSNLAKKKCVRWWAVSIVKVIIVKRIRWLKLKSLYELSPKSFNFTEGLTELSTEVVLDRRSNHFVLSHSIFKAIRLDPESSLLHSGEKHDAIYILFIWSSWCDWN